MSDKNIPENAPEHCPGTKSEEAGKASTCAGCPNQQICASGKPKEEDPDVEVIVQRLKNVKHKILILSGKGGVGKSTLTGQLSFGLAENLLHENKNVGVMDIDICGPSLPQIFGVPDEQVHNSGAGWSPVYVDDNLSVMSVGFLLSGPDEAVIWRGPKKNGLIKQFLRDVDWGDLEYLVVDTPPGTSDEHLSITQYLKAAGVSGAVVITTPQEVSLLDVRKEITFCRKVNVPIIGVIENMSGFACPKCLVTTEIFPPSTGGAEQMCKEMNCNFLGKIPLDPRIGQCSDEGKSLLKEAPDSPASVAYLEIIQKIRKYCEESAKVITDGQ